MSEAEQKLRTAARGAGLLGSKAGPPLKPPDRLVKGAKAISDVLDVSEATVHRRADAFPSKVTGISKTPAGLYVGNVGQLEKFRDAWNRGEVPEDD